MPCFVSVKGTPIDCSHFSRKIVDLEDFALPAAILGECQNYLGGGVRFGRKREKYLPPPAAINPDALLA